MHVTSHVQGGYRPGQCALCVRSDERLVRPTYSPLVTSSLIDGRPSGISRSDLTVADRVQTVPNVPTRPNWITIGLTGQAPAPRGWTQCLFKHWPGGHGRPVAAATGKLGPKLTTGQAAVPRPKCSRHNTAPLALELLRPWLRQTLPVLD